MENHVKQFYQSNNNKKNDIIHVFPKCHKSLLTFLSYRYPLDKFRSCKTMFMVFSCSLQNNTYPDLSSQTY